MKTKLDNEPITHALDEAAMITLMTIRGWTVEKRRGGFARVVVWQQAKRRKWNYKKRREEATGEEFTRRRHFNSVDAAFTAFMREQEENG